MTDTTWLSAVMALLEKHGLAELEYQDGDRHILATRHDVHDLATHEPPPAPRRQTTIAAPHAGIFRSKHPCDQTQKSLPRPVRRGEIIGFLEAVSLLRPVLAAEDGILASQLAEEGALTGYGAALFGLYPADGQRDKN
ncbi:MAG TPA: hypothetical protein DIC56_21595 [Rhizobium sp.]|nr:hypothetical protein [Rhizobium sp.]